MNDKNGIRILPDYGAAPADIELKEEILAKTKGTCFYCHMPLQITDYDADNYLTIDHFIPLCKNGTDDIKNLVPSCRECNVTKGDMIPLSTKRKYKK